MRTAITAAACAVSFACNGGGRTAEPGVEPTFRGPVVSVTHRATASGIHVVGGAGDACGLVATSDTATLHFVRTRTGSLRPASIGEIAVGDTVEIHVSGPVAESCPLQGRAATIIRVEHQQLHQEDPGS